MAKISKDFIKFRQHIRSLNISVNEQYLLELFFEFHNCNYGYAYLQIKDILVAFGTTSKNRITTTIKSLEEKGLIVVNREHKNNRYFVVDINNFITIKSTEKEPDSVVKVEESKDDPRVIMIKDTVSKGKVSNELVEIAMETDIKVIEGACADAKVNCEEGYINSKFLIGSIEHNKKRKKGSSNVVNVNFKKDKFNSFSQRSYDFEELERKLLGWDK